MDKKKKKKNGNVHEHWRTRTCKAQTGIGSNFMKDYCKKTGYLKMKISLNVLLLFKIMFAVKQRLTLRSSYSKLFELPDVKFNQNWISHAEVFCVPSLLNF